MPLSPNLIFALVWHGLAAAILVLVSSHLLLEQPLWKLGSPQVEFLGRLVICYGVLACAVSIRVARNGHIRPAELAFAVCAVFGVFCFGLLVFDAYYVASVLAWSVVFSAVAVALPQTFTTSLRIPAIAVLTVTSGLLMWVGIQNALWPHDVSLEQSIARTTLYSLKIDRHRGVAQSKSSGGGIAVLDDGYLLASGDGRLLHLRRTGPGEPLQRQELAFRVPLNRDEFVADTAAEVAHYWFRVADILVQDLGGEIRLFVLHHHWRREEACFVARVSVARGPRHAFTTGAEKLNWKTLYETEPCLPINESEQAMNLFAGHQIGGRMLLMDERTILLTLGDHEFDGVNSDLVLPQDPATAYGKTVLLDTEDGSVEFFTMGHRNPQGLYIAPEGTIWLTEHGPAGGDELNLLTRGANYGWPYTTHGVDYESTSWPLSKNQGRHEGYREPVFAWLPSIGVSELVGIEKDLFESWRGDLLVSSLRARSLIRMRVREGRVVFAEKIAIGGQIRDLLEDPYGRIVLWLDDGSVAFIEPVPTTKGGVGTAIVDERLRGELGFGLCRGCHEVGDGTKHAIGPDLAGVFGRTVASAQGFDYSSALKETSGHWDEEALDRYLENPGQHVPGTSMQFAGIPDADDRRVLIEYLRSVQ